MLRGQIKCSTTLSLLVILLLHSCFGPSEARNERYEPNVDFLLHEAGNPGQTQQFGKNKDDFPPLVTPPNRNSQSTTSNGKRDYVAPNSNQWPALKPVSTPGPHQSTSLVNTNNRRDYVAPSSPTPKPWTSTTWSHGQNKHQSSLPQNKHQSSLPQDSSSKRDYVATNWPTLRPVSTPGGNKGQQPTKPPVTDQHANVKGLINFFNKNDETVKTTPMPTKVPSVTTAKPLSFSDIVSGNKKPTENVGTSTQKPTFTTQKSSGSTGSVLPSSIVNKNKQSNGVKVSDNELQSLSEELIRKDTNNAAKYITINYQGKTSSGSKDDKAPLPLLTIPNNVWNIPTIQKFIPLLDNYERDTLINEYVTPQERNEENAFMDVIMSTQVIRHLMNFLKEKGYVSPDPKQQRDFLKLLWFTLYSRGKGKLGSSGFEHVFVSELKNGEVSGLHNWIYFGREEAANRANYLGYLKYSQFNDKGAVLKFHFSQQGVDKPVNSLFIGTSPELEMALYTLCFVTRADEECGLRLGGKSVNIKTHTFRYRSKNLIGSAFPQI